MISFHAQDPELAGIEIIVLPMTVLAGIRLTWPCDRIASLALLPYAGWVTFAAVLTWSIAASN